MTISLGSHSGTFMTSRLTMVVTVRTPPLGRRRTHIASMIIHRLQPSRNWSALDLQIARPSSSATGLVARTTREALTFGGGRSQPLQLLPPSTEHYSRDG